MLVREMNVYDLGEVVRIHQIAFEGFFLTRIGPRFLRAYYQTVLEFGTSIALVAHDQETGRIVGFATGFKEPQGFYLLLRQRRKKMFPTILRAIVGDPGLLPQILRNLRRVERQAKQQVDAVELSSIAVAVTGRGVGGLLLETFADLAAVKGASKIILTTDAENNEAVRGFYETRGFSIQLVEKRGERRLCHYVREFG